MIWLNLLIFLIVIAGHTEVQVMLINRVHSQRMQQNVLRHLEHLHEVLILIFPPLLVWFAGFRGPSLLAGGTWSDVPLGWWVLFVICGLGFVGQAICAVRWQTRRDPDQLSREQSQVWDIAERLGEQPAGTGINAALAKLPGNQVFHLELAEKQFHLPALPAAWDGLTILHLTDWHFHGTPDRRYFEEVIREAEQLSPDLICFTGDLLDDMDCLDWLPATLGRLQAPLGQFYILGNHDWRLDPPPIRETMQEIGWEDVAGRMRAVSHNGLPLLISGTELPWMGHHPDLAAGPDAAFRLLLSHTPDNFDWAKQHGVDLMLSGHNHGGQIVFPVVGPLYSPSRYGVRYSAGCWYEQGTLMYVSRGLSGGHPVRYNCRPEITLLTLFSQPASSSVIDEQSAQQPVALSKAQEETAIEAEAEE